MKLSPRPTDILHVWLVISVVGAFVGRCVQRRASLSGSWAPFGASADGVVPGDVLVATTVEYQ